MPSNAMAQNPERRQLLSEIMVAAKRLDALQARLAEIEGDDWDDADTVVSDGGGPLFTPHEEDSDDGDDGQGDGADPDLDLTTLPRARDKKRGLKQVGRAPRPSVKKETAAVLNIPAAPVSLVGTLEAAKPEAEFDKRYEPGEMLGEGGMGEVRLYRDKRVGREVAIKSLHAEARDSAKYRERFLFEARVQGQLEHPGVVPVYDIGKLPDGTEFLSMKRLSGQTLREVINALRKKDRATAFTFTRRRLLAAFQSLCLVVDYAHQKGVIHRDIKPTNIMLGHYGEVQLLDWGVAKLNEAGSSAKLGFEVEHEATEVGEVMGTPGYMSPEQATGTSKVDARSDIFSLGAILFEILTYERLVPYQEGDVTQLTLLGGYDAHISQRFPGSDVPTELEQLCVAATEHNPDERTMTAREIHDAIEQHLEGEGDAKRRQSMSRKHTRAAISALSQIAEGGGMAHAPQAADLRASAIQNVMRALALDPDNQVAMQTMVRLMTDLPEVPSSDAQEAIGRAERTTAKRTSRRGALAFALCATNVAAAAILGVTNALFFVLPLLLLAGAALLSMYAAGRAQPPRALAYPIVFLSTIAFALTSTMFGPFMFAPILIVLNVILVASFLDRPTRLFAMALGAAGVLVPIALNFLGVVAPVTFSDGLMTSSSLSIGLPELPTTIFLGLVLTEAVVLPGVLVGAARDARRAAERRLTLQAFQLAEFLPREARAANTQPPSTSP